MSRRPHLPPERLAVTLVFFANGGLFASWASRIPAISERTDASTGALGLALVAPAVAAVLTMPLVGRLLPGRSSRAFCLVSMALLAAAVVLPAAVTSVAALALVLLVVGVGNSALDIAMNAAGVTIERRMRHQILSSLHAFFSFGGFAGAGLGALAAALGVDPLPHLLAAAALFGAIGLAAAARLPRIDEDPHAEADKVPWHRLPPRLLLMGVACFFCLLAEGGAQDWSAKLVRDDFGASAALGAVAYAAFAAGMAGSRLVTDALWRRWGAVRLLRTAGTVAAAGFGAALLVGSIPVAIAGFAALGLGLGGVVPTLFRAAAEEPGVPTGPALAATSSLGYLGFLAGPPLIGGLAELTSLRAAASLMALAGLLVVVLASTARAPAAPAPRPLPDPAPTP